MVFTEWVRDRLHGLNIFRWMPRERRWLQGIRALTNVGTYASAHGGYWLAETWLKLPTPVAFGAAGIIAILFAIVSADFIENRLRRWIIGMSYNPNMWAMQEWESGMFPTEQEFEAQWREEINKVRAPWWGEKIGNE